MPRYIYSIVQHYKKVRLIKYQAFLVLLISEKSFL